MHRELIVGPNFSGRSEALRTHLAARTGASFFVGPYAEGALSGLSATVADEIAIYAAPRAQRAVFAAQAFEPLRLRKPATLSGGEQVMLALHCFSRSAYDGIAIDTALEQLDEENRAAAFAYLSGGSFDVVLIDNRVRALATWSCRTLDPASRGPACDLARATADLKPCHAPEIGLTDLDFGYRPNEPIFLNLKLTLVPGQAYRLLGPNGSGKTTLLKLLVGVLRPARGRIELDGAPYDPRRSGNRAIAAATQNPDHQWCGPTLREDMMRRRKAFAASGLPFPSDGEIETAACHLGATSLDQHLYELPLAARKRLSWLWPLCGALPWIVLDEPTIGQDSETRTALAATLSHLCTLGYGVIFITHDDDFAALLPHRLLRIADRTIRTS
jgi:energy-coupling factor transporter ATP-binding protein EcfA2